MTKRIETVCVIAEDLAIRFEDGSEMYLPLAMLRRACPCARCQGEPDAMGRVVRPVVEWGSGAFDLRSIEMVGGYGLRLQWADEHGTGIYSVDYLGKLDGLAGEGDPLRGEG